METLHFHYARLLGIDESWRVAAVELHVEQRRVQIRLTHVGPGAPCPDCGRTCGLADHADERRWRHLDTMQFATELVARLPRCRCPEHGVKTIIPPWAGKHSRFTLLVEAFAVEVLLACRTVVQDLESGAIVFIGRGKGAAALDPFWKRLAGQRPVSCDQAAEPASVRLPQPRVLRTATLCTAQRQVRVNRMSRDYSDSHS